MKEYKSKRITIDLTDPGRKEIDRLCYITGWSIADLFRSALTHERKIIMAYNQGGRAYVEDNTKKRTELDYDWPRHRE